MLKAGRYNATPVSAELTEASTGTPQVAVMFEVEAGDTTELITWYGFLTDAALPWTLKALRALGFEGNNLEDVEKQNLEDASIVVEMDEYNGEERPKVRWVNAKGSINLKPMENKSNFAKSMAAKIAALEAGQGPAKSESLDEILDDDDVPFNV